MSHKPHVGTTFLEALFKPEDPARRALAEGQKTRAAIAELAEAQRRAAAASTAQLVATESTESLHARVALLERNLAATALYGRALAQVLVDKGVMTSAELAATMEALDLLDGVRDGR